MKKGIHPEYKDSIISCACGAVVNTKSTGENIRVDICSKCHPFFTGQQKFVDAAGMVEKFQKRYQANDESTKKKVTEVTETKEASIDDVLNSKEVK